MSRSQVGHYGTIRVITKTHRLMVMHPHTKYHWPLDKKILFKNNYLTFRSKVMVPRRSLRYTTNHLMVMHPHIKYHWPISKDKNVMVRKSFAEKKQKQKKKIRLKPYISPFVRNGDIIKIHIQYGNTLFITTQVL